MTFLYIRLQERTILMIFLGLYQLFTIFRAQTYFSAYPYKEPGPYTV